MMMAVEKYTLYICDRCHAETRMNIGSGTLPPNGWATIHLYGDNSLHVQTVYCPACLADYRRAVAKMMGVPDRDSEA
jgi:hypothetical protein